ncbi:hypothetical protein KY335_03015 [Candidatus Woesearchaeota archaeon]|nr:hypothetical protein [Candidatus Woesearchaeota archaeon]
MSLKALLIFLLTITGLAVYEDTVNIEVHFSPENLTSYFIDYIQNANSSLDCALYDYSEQVKQELMKKSQDIPVYLVLDDENADMESDAVQTDSYGLMHNKFCFRDSKDVWTGSYNPTDRGTLNDNNALIIYSEHIAEIYQEEFDEMWSGIFKRGDRTGKNKINYNENMIEIYFCPEDHCADKVYQVLEDAEQSIHFMTFSFTRTDYLDLLNEKSQTVEIKGIFEKSRITQQYNIYNKLSENQKITLKLDNNKYTMHHKVFIVDKKIVITGSFNPTKSADESNDENLLILHDKDIAQKYLEEFDRVWNQ